MGNKLGKMVKLFNTLFLFFFVLIINAAPPSQIEKKLNLADTKPSLEMDAAIFSLVGSKSGITLKKTKIAKPSNRSLATFKLLSKKDDFALKVLDKNKKEVLLLGLGNPFYIHAQHIGYEDRKVFGGYIEQDIELALPLNIDASYIILLSQGPYGLKVINEIKVK
jgi:hypothetical protein